jgi:hypothetical protein
VLSFDEEDDAWMGDNCTGVRVTPWWTLDTVGRWSQEKHLRGSRREVARVTPQRKGPLLKAQERRVLVWWRPALVLRLAELEMQMRWPGGDVGSGQIQESGAQ